MKLLLKILGIVLVLAAIFALEFSLWGDQFDRLFNQQECARWFAEARPYAWALGIGLLVADLILPIPATGIMAALGSVYGIALGTLVATLGSAGAGVTGYLLARSLPEKATRFLASEEEIERFRDLFECWGGGAIIISRIMPILPEVMTILAGLAKMDVTRFLAALLLGTVPTSLLFAYLGYVSRSAPGYGIVAAALIPLSIWPLFLKFVYLKNKRHTS